MHMYEFNIQISLPKHVQLFVACYMLMLWTSWWM